MTVFSGNLWSCLKEVNPLVVFDGDHRMALWPKKGNRVSSQDDLGYTELLKVAAVISGSSTLVTMLSENLWSCLTKVKPLLFDGECRIALEPKQGNWASS